MQPDNDHVSKMVDERASVEPAHRMCRGFRGVAFIIHLIKTFKILCKIVHTA